MPRIAVVLLSLVLAAVVGCAPATSPSPSASAGPVELRQTARALPAGSYTRSDFSPRITFELGEGWSVGSVAAGFFDVQQQQGTPGVIAVQFANVGSALGQDGATVEATSVATTIAAVKANPGLVSLGEDESRLGGLTGTVVEVENRGPAHAPIIDVPAGRLGIDPGRRVWIALFDTTDGVLAVMVGGSTADWEHALSIAEPVLESVVIGT